MSEKNILQAFLLVMILPGIDKQHSSLPLYRVVYILHYLHHKYVFVVDQLFCTLGPIKNQLFFQWPQSLLLAKHDLNFQKFWPSLKGEKKMIVRPGTTGQGLQAKDFGQGLQAKEYGLGTTTFCGILKLRQQYPTSTIF